MYLFKKYTPIVVLLFFISSVNSQNKSVKNVGISSDKQTTGVSVSPAHFHLNLKQGQSKVYSININNDTSSPKSFQVKMMDFNMNGKGKSSFLPAGNGKYSLSKWVSISPTFVELKPNEKRKVDFTVSVPNDSDGAKAAWSIIMIEQQQARQSLSPDNKSDNTVALGVVPTFAFGVFVYQNPPGVALNEVEFVDFVFDENNKQISIVAENKGDGISYCTSYIDLTNLKTGDQQRLKVKKFTILPDLIRDFIFKIPDNHEPGDYIAVGVLDFENSDEIQAAKMEFKLN
ncbi:DUF916 domain-containing protein [Flavicella sp.]|uniref:WxL protein peptidoglycan domain-containing protein n=1 Tax=Flavicella sp. TaxID=2957742 RepID=UPI0026315F30|nr:DUF916 domain-containing protein [Flavicella sp.]MDG1803751.1 DUF916 domain-containing protein [Flavicella sp.]